MNYGPGDKYEIWPIAPGGLTLYLNGTIWKMESTPEELVCTKKQVAMQTVTTTVRIPPNQNVRAPFMTECAVLYYIPSHDSIVVNVKVSEEVVEIVE